MVGLITSVIIRTMFMAPTLVTTVRATVVTRLKPTIPIGRFRVLVLRGLKAKKSSLPQNSPIFISISVVTRVTRFILRVVTSRTLLNRSRLKLMAS